MQKLHRNQSGYGIIEAIFVAIIVAMILSVGWLVYSYKSTPLKTPSPGKQVPRSTIGTGPAYQGWKFYSDRGIRFKYPPNWFYTQSCVTGDAAHPSCLAISGIQPDDYSNSLGTSKYSGNLMVWVNEAVPGNNTYNTSAQGVIGEPITVNGMSLNMVQLSNSRGVYEILLGQCSAKACSYALPTRSGNYMYMGILPASENPVQAAPYSYPIHLPNPDYDIIKTLLQSLQF